MELIQRIDAFFYALVLLCIYVFSAGKRMHGKDWLNPLGAFVLLPIGVFTGASYLSVLAFLEPDSTTEEFFRATLQMSFLYLLATYVGYSLRPNPVRVVAYRLLRGTVTNRQPVRVRWPFIALLLCGAAVSFLLLMATSGAGLLWLSETRVAYQLYRRGVGHWWLIYQWLVMAAFFASLALRRDKPLTYRQLLAQTLLFSGLLYFSGSKSAMLSVFIVAMLYAHYFIAKIRALNAILFSLFVIALFLLQLVVSGAFNDIIAAGAYFVDYFFYGAEFLSKAEEIGFRYGEGWLTSLWFYVPRALYESKPYEYGLTLIHQHLFPGLAEEGTTPGLMIWSLSYLDFGPLGVAVEGFMIGSFERAVYLRFIRSKSMAMFMVLVSACYIPIFAYATPILYLSIASLFGLALIRFDTRRKTKAMRIKSPALDEV